MKTKDYPKISKVEVFDYTCYPKVKVNSFTVSKNNTNVRTIQIDEDGVLRVFVTPKHLKNPICACGRRATRQTANGKYQEETGALPQNFGWYCDECWKRGEDEEDEAMHGR